MSVFSDLVDAWPLAPIAAGVLLLVLFGRDPKAADEHDLSDYHQPTRPATMLRRVDFDTTPERVRLEDILPAVSVELVDILPPAPPGMNAGSPLYAGMLFDTWFPGLDVDAVAGRMLRELGDEARAEMAR